MSVTQLLDKAARLYKIDTKFPVSRRYFTPLQQGSVLDAQHQILKSISSFSATTEARHKLKIMRHTLHDDIGTFDVAHDPSTRLLLDDIITLVESLPDHLLGTHWFVFLLTNDRFKYFFPDGASRYYTMFGAMDDDTRQTLLTSHNTWSHHWSHGQKIDAVREVERAYTLKRLLQKHFMA